MPHYALAVLPTAQTKLKKKYTEAELRDKLRPTIQKTLQNQEFTMPDAASQRKSDSRPVETHFLLKKAAGADVQKTTRPTSSNYGDSAKVTLAWTRFVEKFPFSRKLLQSNNFSAEEIFRHELEQAIFNLHNRMETAAVNYAFTNRCQRTAAQLGDLQGSGVWSDVNKQLDIAAADKDYFTQNVGTFMNKRYYRGSLDAICDLRLLSQVQRVQAQGAGNSTNLAFQFGRINYMSVTDEIFAGNTNGQALVMPSGLFSCMPWNDPLNRKGFGIPDSYNGVLTTFKDPFGLNMSYDLSITTERADTTAIGGHVQDVVDMYELTATVGFALPPIGSVANDSIVHLIAQG